jgi:hypothetical protein
MKVKDFSSLDDLLLKWGYVRKDTLEVSLSDTGINNWFTDNVRATINPIIGLFSSKVFLAQKSIIKFSYEKQVFPLV